MMKKILSKYLPLVANMSTLLKEIILVVDR